MILILPSSLPNSHNGLLQAPGGTTCRDDTYSGWKWARKFVHVEPTRRLLIAPKTYAQVSLSLVHASRRPQCVHREAHVTRRGRLSTRAFRSVWGGCTVSPPIIRINKVFLCSENPTRELYQTKQVLSDRSAGKREVTPASGRDGDKPDCIAGGLSSPITCREPHIRPEMCGPPSSIGLEAVCVAKPRF